MDNAEQQNSAFLIRIRWERHSGPLSLQQPRAKTWRGWVQGVRSGRQIFFGNLETLTTFIAEETGMPPRNLNDAPGPRSTVSD